MQQIVNKNFEGRIEFLLSAGEQKVRLSQDARQELLRKFREMIEGFPDNGFPQVLY